MSDLGQGFAGLSSFAAHGEQKKTQLSPLTSFRLWNVIGGAQYESDVKQAVQLCGKRLMDIVLSALALILLSPLLLAVMIAIPLESRGSPFYSQLRWGKGNKKIRVYKFRSMRSDQSDASGVVQAVQGDPRVTRLGRFLRKSNVDELPQLFNVLRGDMSLVGPRCHPIGMMAAGMPYEHLVPSYHRRHVLRPGLTGLAQVRGLRGPTVRADKARARIAADLHYIDNFSLWLDAKILIGTVVSEMRGGRGF